MNKIDNLRAQIVALAAEQAAIITQPISRVALEVGIRETVKDCETVSEAQTLQNLQRLAAAQYTPLATVRPGINGQIDLLPVMIRFLGTAAVTKALLRGLDAVPVGLEPDARTKRLRAIVAELHALELEEETAIREGGDVVQRRVDASPAAVLSL